MFVSIPLLNWSLGKTVIRFATSVGVKLSARVTGLYIFDYENPSQN